MLLIYNPQFQVSENCSYAFETKHLGCSNTHFFLNNSYLTANETDLKQDYVSPGAPAPN